MNIKTRMLACTTSVVFACGLAVAAAPAAHAAVAPLDPTQWSVACDSLTGTIKFATAISLAPSTTDNTITVKAVTSGCTVPQTPGSSVSGDPVNCVLPTPLGLRKTGKDGNISSGSNVVTAADGAFVAGDVGHTVVAAGIPVPAVIGSLNSATSVNLVTDVGSNNPANATLTSAVTVLSIGGGIGSQPCVNLAPAKLGGVLTSLAGHNNFYNTASDGHTTSGSALISCASCNFNNLETGNTITGVGIPGPGNPTALTPNTTITVTGAHTATMSANAQTTSTTQHFAHADSSGCLGLSGLSTGTGGSNVTQFKNQSKGLDGLTALPKLLDPTDANVTSAVNSTLGTTFTTDSWGASYGEFQIGTAFGTNPASRSTGAFQGGDNGANDQFDGTTGESSGAILIQCLGKGLKAITFGIGHVSFG